jgi:tetratricopeptide (TPR) repeat protein
VPAAESQQSLLERAGGNPLYAVQFVDLYVELGSTDELRLPETLQGIIAARLDGLPDSEKGLLQDAAVVGKVFWTSSIGRDAAAATASLHSLERKGFVRRQRRSSLDGESEFAFAHALVRDVAYGQIARADRAAKHKATAEWISGLGRPEDHAEMLAYHWGSALELVRAAGAADDELAERARYALRDAGDRAFSLNSFAVAVAQYEDALALWPDDAERPELLFKRAVALHWSYDDRQEEALEAARDALIAVGDSDRASETESVLSRVHWDRGQHDLVREHLARAEALAGDSVSAAAARVLAVSGRIRAIAGEHEEGRRLAEAALVMATELRLDELHAHALTTIGMAKYDAGDPSGVKDMERALEIALAVDSPIAGTIVNNLAVYATFAGDFPRTDELYGEALRLAERYGDASTVRFVGGNRIWLNFMLGRWDQALESANAFIAECGAGSPHTQEGAVREVRAALSIARGDRERALRDQQRALELANAQRDPFQHLASLASTAVIYAELGRLDDGYSLAVQVPPLVREIGLHGSLTLLALLGDELGIGDDLREAAARTVGPRVSAWTQPGGLIERILAGELDVAADMIRSAGNPTIEANIRKHAGFRMLGAGRTADAQVELERALDFYRAVEASFYIEQIEGHSPALRARRRRRAQSGRSSPRCSRPSRRRRHRARPDARRSLVRPRVPSRAPARPAARGRPART